MDTNQNNRTDNYQINSFTKGMNSDTSYDMVGAEQYLFGLNIRITNNTLIAGETTSNYTENAVNAVLEGKYTPITKTVKVKAILATASIEDVGAIVVKGEDDLWYVYRANLNGDEIVLTKVFKSKNTTNKDRFSVVINNELSSNEKQQSEKSVLKLYIADGLNPIMCINLNDESYYLNADETWLISNKIYPTNKVQFINKISGQLKTQQVQYTYRFYKKYGISSKLAPITNKINVIDSNRNKETGNAEDSITSVGFKLRIEYPEYYSNVFDHIQVFRISYIKHGENAEINLIYDAKIQSGTTQFNLNDTGILSLAQYSMDEFSALTGTTLIPQILELNQGYMFAGNITDDSSFKIDFEDYNPRTYQFDSYGRTKYYDSNYSKYSDNKNVIYKSDLYYLNDYVDINSSNNSEFKYDTEGYYGGEGPNVSWRFITCHVPLDLTDSYETAPSWNSTNNDNKLYYIHNQNGLVPIRRAIGDYFIDKGVFVDETITYNEIFTSSLLRSLRRDEVYRYGIVFYDDCGIRSDVLWIADIRTPNMEEFGITDTVNNVMYARPIGILFQITKPNIGRNITSYQIVRCEKSNTYTKNLLQVALSRPLRLGKYDQPEYRTPYFPNVYLSTQFFYIRYGFSLSDNLWNDSHTSATYLWGNDSYGAFYDKGCTNCENNNLFQLFSPEINLRRQDILANFSSTDIKLTTLYYASDNRNITDISKNLGRLGKDVASSDSLGWNDPAYSLVEYYTNDDDKGKALYYYDGEKVENTIGLIDKFRSILDDLPEKFVHKLNENVYISTKFLLNRFKSDKIDLNLLIKPYCKIDTKDCKAWKYHVIRHEIPLKNSTSEITHIQDVKNPNWDDGFSDVLVDNGRTVTGAIKKYKSYSTNIGTENYVNWVANGLYDEPSCKNEVSITPGADGNFYVFTGTEYIGDRDLACRSRGAYGWIGPGPICLIANILQPGDDSLLSNHVLISDDLNNFGTVCASIQHTAVQFAGLSSEEKLYDIYYGFGNFGKFDNNVSTTHIFDGEMYIVPAEFVNMFKTYNFNDLENTLVSGQVVYYIPLESKINTYFDYGMNYKNTSSPNLLLEPGTITGVTSQDRPLHQYNMIYSDNDTSNDVFTPQSLEDYISTYKQRVHYSQLKTNGEGIDNWLIFKPADFIDADSRYGQLTNLLTVNDTLFFWQNQAFGKLSVNERSLVTDNNSNTIQLGQGGVLQRTDYLNTRYGMREQDYSAISAEGNIYWIDSNNRTVALFREGVVNYCEYVNVQNIVNERADNSYRPHIDYDMQNLEVLCKFLTDGNLLIFSSKLGVGTSIYTRDYESTIQFNNVVYGLKIANNKVLNATQYNYLTPEKSSTYLSPTMLQFVVNSSPSLTKVFDNQKVVTMKRNYVNDSAERYMENKKYSFTTDICGVTELKEITNVTDREGNICYTIPRFDNAAYGNRIRGKWLKVDIVDSKPNKESSISHIITKFRQSYS